MNDPIVGIDLGTTNSLVGIVDSGFPILLADAAGERLTPSVVEFLENGDDPRVGGASGIASIKRLMGARVGETGDFPHPIAGQPGQPARVQAGGRAYLPEEVSAFILRKLKADAERALGVPVNRAVITVPAYFNDAQRAATKAAGELAGFAVERIVNEPTAAALAYGLDRLGSRARVAVYDLGGGTFDISILEMNLGVFEVLSTNGNTRLGGDDIDAALLRSLGLDAASLPAIRAAKVRLSAAEADGDLTRAWVESVARPIVEKTRVHCLRALADAGLAPADLDAVILVGGATRMPLVRALVADIFGRAPDTSQNPDEAVALGAAIQAGILAGAVNNMVLLDITPLSLGIETFGGLTNVIIPRNSTIPTKAGELFTNAVAGQRTVRIHVVQGEREKAADNWTLGAFELDFQAGPRGSARVGVQFEIDADGILHVLARDTHTGAEKIVPMTSAVDVSDEQVEAMIADSVEHAFDDYEARLLVETRLKSEEMLPAVTHALALVGDALPAGERAEIEAQADAVRAALAAGDVARLKDANAALDAATQGLAAILIEQAASGRA